MSESDTSLAHLGMLYSETSTLRTFVGGRLSFVTLILKCNCEGYLCSLRQSTVDVPKCFIKHMCFIVLYFHGHAFFSLEIAKMCFFVLYFLKNVLYFCELFKWVEFLFQVFIYNTKIDEL